MPAIKDRAYYRDLAESVFTEGLPQGGFTKDVEAFRRFRFRSALEMAETGAPTKAARDPGFDSYLRTGIKEKRAMSEGTGISPFVPTGFADVFFQTLKAVDNFQSSDVISYFETEKGSPWALPIVSDVTISAVIATEGDESKYADPGTGVLQFDQCPTLRSQAILVSNELVSDFGFDIQTFIATVSAVRIARKRGSLNITDVKAAAGTGATAAGAGAASQTMGSLSSASDSLSSDDLIRCAASLDQAYAQNGHWILNRKTLLAIAALRGTTGTLALKLERDPDTGYYILLGAPCLICPSMDDLGTTGKVPVIFGDPKFYVERSVRNTLEVKVSQEAFASTGQTFYEARWRVQGGVAFPTNVSPAPPSPFVALVQG